MEEYERTKRTQKMRIGTLVSGIYLIISLVCSIFTMKTCFPQATRPVEAWLGLEEGGRTREAFAALRDALAQGDGVAAAFAESYQVITGETP